MNKEVRDKLKELKPLLIKMLEELDYEFKKKMEDINDNNGIHDSNSDVME